MRIRHFKKMSMLRVFATTMILLSLSQASHAQNASVDSLSDEGHTFKPQQLIIPSSLVLIGAFGVDNGWFCNVKEDVRSGFQDLRGDSRFHADDYLQYLPMASNIGLGILGIESRHPLRERIATSATAYIAMGIMVYSTKHIAREKRPDSDTKNSFPSGHTARAFMGAELIRQEYGNAYGAGAYCFATGIAFLRLYNDRHWLNDVIAGAGIGILSARIAYWLLPLEKKLLGWDDRKTTLAFTPSFMPETNTIGLSLSAQF